MGPVGIILGLIGLLTAAFVGLYQNNEAFRAAIDKLVAVFMTLVSTIGEALMPIFDTLKQIWDEVFTIISSTIAEVAQIVVPIFTEIIGIITDTMVPVIQQLAPIFQQVFGVIGNVIKIVLAVIKPIILFLARLFGTILVVQIKVMGAVVKTVMNVFSTVIKAAFRAFEWAWNNILKPAIGLFKAGFDGIVSFIRNIRDSIGRVWDGIIDKVKGPIRTIVNGINSWLIRPLNAVTSKFGLNIDPIRSTSLKEVSSGHVVSLHQAERL